MLKVDSKLNIQRLVSIEDLRLQAKRRMPRVFYDYVESGSWEEATCRANRNDLDSITLRQRVAVDVSNRKIDTTMLGDRVAAPVAIAPTGLAGMVHPDGEMLLAQAAEREGVPFVLSTMSICSIEDVASVTNKPFWFQLYLMRDREFVKRLLIRASNAGCTTLVLTLDLQVMARRYRDIRNGLSVPPKLTLSGAANFLCRPRWCLGMLCTPRRTFGNIIGHVDGVVDTASIAEWNASQFDDSLSWDDVAWVRRQWSGKMILKGILDPEDAQQAVAIGADAIVVSNHGGRQLDGAGSAVVALDRITQRVSDTIEIQADGGIQSGLDVLRMLALGARGVYLGRAALYGLGAGGQCGVERAIQIVKDDLLIGMALCGLTSLRSIDRSNLHI